MNRTQAALALLTRLHQWDVMGIPDSDGAYWRREIDAVLAMPETDQERLARECQEMFELATPSTEAP